MPDGCTGAVRAQWSLSFEVTACCFGGRTSAGGPFVAAARKFAFFLFCFALFGSPVSCTCRGPRLEFGAARASVPVLEPVRSAGPDAESDVCVPSTTAASTACAIA